MKVALCGIAKNENRYINEWLDYHIGIGVDKVFIYDNNDPNGEKITDVVHNDNVNVIDYRGKKYAQSIAYSDCFEKHHEEFDWIIYIDIDEFIVLEKPLKTIKDFLSLNVFNHADIIRLNWIHFSDNEQLDVKDGDYSVMARFTKTVKHKKDIYGKSILRCTINVEGNRIGAHGYYGRLSGEAVNAIGKPCLNTSCKVSDIPLYKNAWINHYATKTIGEYVRQKYFRGDCTTSKNDGKYSNLEHFFEYNTRTRQKEEYANKIIKSMTDKISLQNIPKTMDGVSIIITAYNTEKYIEECLDSVSSQSWFSNHDNYEILVGVDNCQATLGKLMSIGSKYRNLKVFMMKENYGTYITSNTLIKEAKYSYIIRFDSDDVMRPTMVEHLMLNHGDCDIFRFYLESFGEDLSNRSLAHGQIFVKRDFILEFGGYMAWMCAADTEFLERTKPFANVKQTNQVLFDYRINAESLTNKPGVYSLKENGEYRNKCHEYIKNLNIKSREDAYIDMVTGDFDYIDIPYTGYRNGKTKEELIVTMTSWTKRIGNVPRTLDSILSQSLLPDRIVINLSEEEFPNKEIPNDVQRYFDEHNDIIEVQWIQGPNTKQWKKILPTMLKYPDEAIVCIDDDAEYPKDMLETLWSAHKNNPGHPISGFKTNVFGLGIPHCGTCNLDKLEYYGDLFNYLSEELFEMYSSDIFFT